MRLRSCFWLVVLLALLAGCSHESGLANFPSPPPTTTPIPIFDQVWLTGDVAAVLCDVGCYDARALVVDDVARAFASLEQRTAVDVGLQQRVEEIVCDDRGSECSEAPVQRRDLSLAIWHWLGEPGEVLAHVDGHSHEVLAAAALRAVAVDAHLGCADDPCPATTVDLLQTFEAMYDNHLFVGALPAGRPPERFRGEPLWSRTRWKTDGDCLDLEGKPRYGSFQGSTLCISQDLSGELARDVALHELAHLWQVRMIGAERNLNSSDWEADADCWAHVHGAEQTFYVDTGCRDADHKQQILDDLRTFLDLPT